MAQYTIDCTCIADTYVDQSSPDVNYGTATNLSFTESGGGQSVFLKFDIPDEVLHKRILSAVLKTPSGSGNYMMGYVSVRSFKLNWVESTLTYALAANKTEGYSLVENVFRSTTSINESIDVSLNTSAFQSRISNIIAYGLEVYGIDKVNNNPWTIVISSRSVTGYEPYLTIVYEDAPPNAPTPTEPIGAYKDSTSITRFSW